MRPCAARSPGLTRTSYSVLGARTMHVMLDRREVAEQVDTLAAAAAPSRGGEDYHRVAPRSASAGQGVGKVGSGAWLGDELDGSFWAS